MARRTQLVPHLTVDELGQHYKTAASAADDLGMGQGEGVILTTDTAGRYYINFRDYWNTFGPTTTYSIKAGIQTGLVGDAPAQGSTVQNRLDAVSPGGGK